MKVLPLFFTLPAGGTGRTDDDHENEISYTIENRIFNDSDPDKFENKDSIDCDFCNFQLNL